MWTRPSTGWTTNLLNEVAKRGASQSGVRHEAEHPAMSSMKLRSVELRNGDECTDDLGAALGSSMKLRSVELRNASSLVLLQLPDFLNEVAKRGASQCSASR